MIIAIEGTVGIWKAVWNEWPTMEIETLYNHLTAPEKSTIEIPGRYKGNPMLD